MFSVSMLIFIFVLWVLLSYISICLLVHYTELRLRLACQNAFAYELVICSLNVRGLSNTMKRREIFRWLKTKKIRNILSTRSPLFEGQRNMLDLRMGVFSYI